MGLRGLESHLAGVVSYLQRVVRRELPLNYPIIHSVQVGGDFTEFIKINKFFFLIPMKKEFVKKLKIHFPLLLHLAVHRILGHLILINT
jgi:hypothetical protein